MQILKSKVLYMLLVCAITVIVFLTALDGISRQVDSNQIIYLQNAVRRCAVQCYAIEGRFPDNIRHLEENYNLIIDRSRYIVHYECPGGNLIPQIWVFPLANKAA